MKKFLKMSSNRAATAQYQHNNLNKWWLLMVFFFVLFAGNNLHVWAQSPILHVAVTQPNPSFRNFRVDLSTDNPYPYQDVNYPHTGGGIAVVLTFRFKSAANAVLYETNLPIGFYASDYNNIGWTTSNFINTYWVTPCLNAGTFVASVDIVSTISVPTLDTYTAALPVDVSITYPSTAMPSGSTNMTIIAQGSPYLADTKTITYEST